MGFLPVFFSSQGGLGHAAVHALPFPVNAQLVIVFVQGGLPEFAEEPPFGPALEVAMQAAAGAELRGSGFPVRAGAQDIEDAIEDLAVGQGGPSALGRAAPLGEQGFQALP